MAAIYVRCNGSTGSDGVDSAAGTLAAPLLTIAAALARIGPYDTVYLDGVFEELHNYLRAPYSSIKQWPGASFTFQVRGDKTLTGSGWTSLGGGVYTLTVNPGSAFSIVGLTQNSGRWGATTYSVLTDGDYDGYLTPKASAVGLAAGEYNWNSGTNLLTARFYGDADPSTLSRITYCRTSTVAGPGSQYGSALFIEADGCTVDGGDWVNFLDYNIGKGNTISGGFGASNGGCRYVTVKNATFHGYGWHAVVWGDKVCQYNQVNDCTFYATNGDNGSGDYGIAVTFRSGNGSTGLGDDYKIIARANRCTVYARRPVKTSSGGVPTAYLPMPAGSTSLAGGFHCHTTTSAGDEPVYDAQFTDCTVYYDNVAGAARGTGLRGVDGKDVATADEQDPTKYGIRYVRCQQLGGDRLETGDNVSFDCCLIRHRTISTSLNSAVSVNSTFGTTNSTAGRTGRVCFRGCQIIYDGTGASLPRHFRTESIGGNARDQRLISINTTWVNVIATSTQLVAFQNAGASGSTIAIVSYSSVFSWPNSTATNCRFLFDDVAKVITWTGTDNWYPMDARLASGAWASNTSFDTKAEWSDPATGRDPSGVYNTNPQFADLSVDATPTAGGNLATRQQTPVPTGSRRFISINGKRYNGRYGAWQDGKRRTSRDRSRARTGSLVGTQ